MRILHFITSLRIGGAERMVASLLPRLSKEGVEVSLLLMDGTRTPLVEDLEKCGITIDSLSMGWRAMRNPLLVFKLIRFLRKKHFDIVHTHNTSCQLMAAFASTFVPPTLVTTEHNTTNKRRACKAYKPIDRWMYGKYQRIACVGKETESALLSYLPKLSGKTVVIPNGIDLNRFREAKPSTALSCTTGFKILMVAAFRAQKDHATLIRALALLPETYHLFLVGGAETPEDERTLLASKQLTQTLNIDDRVYFMGVREDIPELLSACDVAVLSSHFEGFGLSAVEAMASGKVLIASNVESLTSIVSGVGLLFPQGDAEALAARIREVCENPEIAREIGIRGKERAGQYDLARTVQNYYDLYQSLTKRPALCQKENRISVYLRNLFHPHLKT